MKLCTITKTAIRSGFWIPFAGALFALFPLTDTDIWWHLACAREWYFTWTPVRLPAVNVHEYFQQVVYAVYNIGGAPLLVAFKALLWGTVFALFLWPFRKALRLNAFAIAAAVAILFVFRFSFELRPVLFSLLFLGVYWNVLPRLRHVPVAVAVLLLQWLWCRCQGLYVLGPFFAAAVLVPQIARAEIRGRVLRIAFLLALFAMPFLHDDGLRLFLYPFGLLDRLLGLSPSAAAFASSIAENRSPFTILAAGENVLGCALSIAMCAVAAAWALRNILKRREWVLSVSLLTTAVLALVAERNFELFLPVFFAAFLQSLSRVEICLQKFNLFMRWAGVAVIACTLGFWAKSLAAYDSFVAYQRVPVGAAKWMSEHPHAGRLFNDDRAGGYLAFVNPSDSVYVDGRFILKTSEFFERYLRLAAEPSLFLSEVDSLGIDRAVFPLRYYARWGRLLDTLAATPEWEIGYVDEYYIVFCKK